MDSKGFDNEFDWFPAESKDLMKNLIDFHMDSTGFDDEFDWFPKEFSRIWREIGLISSVILKDLAMNFFDLVWNLIDFYMDKGYDTEFNWFPQEI